MARAQDLSRRKQLADKFNFYETLYLVRPDIEGGELSVIQGKITTALKENSGETIRNEKWDERDLAYEIQGYRRGIYHILTYKALADAPVAVEKHLGFHKSEVMRFITVSVDEDHAYGKEIEPNWEQREFSLKKGGFEADTPEEFPAEQKLDLHELDGEEAEKRLVGFIDQLYGAGKKIGLVVCGKRAEPNFTVKKWLENSVKIRDWRAAEKRHGGYGALYVSIGDWSERRKPPHNKAEERK